MLITNKDFEIYSEDKYICITEVGFEDSPLTIHEDKIDSLVHMLDRYKFIRYLGIGEG